MDPVTPHPDFPSLEVFSRESFLSERDIYQRFIDMAVDELETQIGYLHLFDEVSGEISLWVWSGKVFQQCATTHVSHYPLKDAGIWADSVRKRVGIIHNDYVNLEHRNDLPEGHFPISNHLSTPIFDPQGEVIIGIVGVGNRDRDFTDADIDRLQTFIVHGWRVLEQKLANIEECYSSRTHLFNQRNPEDLLSEMISTMGRALELRDEYTSMHQSNVALICDKIAEQLELHEQQRFGLKLGASIHDIGKIAVPSELLTKPSRLHPAEFELVKTHAEMGAEVFKGHDLPWPIEAMIAQHHERMDGSGYPRGLLGQSICVEARIIAVADTFDAISSDRPYRFAPGPHKAVDILREGRGVSFDTYIVDSFFEVLEQDKSLRELYHY